MRPNIKSWMTLLMFTVSVNLNALTLEGIYPIEASENMDLSGLAMCQGKLLTVSDKNSTAIYQIENHSNVFTLTRFQEINMLGVHSQNFQFPNNIYYSIYRLLDNSNYDWEGISCIDQSIYLASERHVKIAEVTRMKSDIPKWHDINIKHIEESGLLAKYNAFVEGLTVDSDYFYLGIEREPRGMVKVDRKTGRVSSNRYHDNNHSKRPADIAGLAMWRDELFLLSRNEESICQVDKVTMDVEKCYSYKEVVQSIKYDSDEYGVVEGMAITDEFIYLVIDNNGMSIKGTDDTRSRLIILNNSLN